MHCDVIRDLLPLYLDGCCSAESARLVESHLLSCEACRTSLACLEKALPQTEPVSVPAAGRICQWRASVLQSVLFLLYFAAITLGVALEAATPFGTDNGYWAFAAVIPATGFLLALINWYFIRVYGSRRQFVLGSLLCTAAATAVCVLAGLRHYEIGLAELMRLENLMGLCFVLVNLVLAVLLSGRYAKLIGKD